MTEWCYPQPHPRAATCEAAGHVFAARLAAVEADPVRVALRVALIGLGRDHDGERCWCGPVTTPIMKHWPHCETARAALARAEEASGE